MRAEGQPAAAFTGRCGDGLRSGDSGYCAPTGRGHFAGYIDPVPEHALSMINSLKTASQAKILLLTRMENADLQDRAILAGACGVLDRGASIPLLFTAVEKVHTGQVWLDRVSTGRVFIELTRMAARRQQDGLVDKLSLLTERERKIVTVIAHNIGDPGKAIAEKLHISESTLRNHLTAIYEKLGVENRHGLVAYAYQKGLAKTE